MSSKTDDIVTTLTEIRERLNSKLNKLSGGTTAIGSDNAARLRKTLVDLENDVAGALNARPPQPPTLRGRVGAWLEQLVHRALFWQYSQARTVQTIVVGHLRAEATAVAQIETTMESLAKRSLELEAEVKSLRQDLSRADRLIEERVSTEKIQRAIVDELRKQVRSLSEKEEATWLNEILPELYLKFEDVFRGTEEDISQRLWAYLPVLAERGIRKGADLILDVGCGRGEWLDILSREGYSARGCDSNTAMVGLCRKRSLDAVAADGAEFLESFSEGSVGAVTSFHVIEHLPLQAILALIDSALRILRQGGVLILETPNPQNALVGFHNFYIDPTHRKPIPSSLLKFLAEARGFRDVAVITRHPYPDWMRLPEESETSKRFNEYFYGPQDYAVVATRP